MPWTVRMLGAVVVSLMLAGAGYAETERQLVVTGEGRSAAAPDMATLSLGVQEEARVASEAMRAASLAAGAILDVLESAGVAPEDVQTSNIGLNPRYDHSNSGAPPRITGYIASNDLTVRVRDLESLGALLDDVVTSGANTFRGVSFGMSDTAAIFDAARTAAVADARRRAGVLAEAAGVSLGPIQSISESGGVAAPQPMMRGAMMAESAAVPIAEGEVTVTARVTIVYALTE